MFSMSSASSDVCRPLPFLRVEIGWVMHAGGGSISVPFEGVTAGKRQGTYCGRLVLAVAVDLFGGRLELLIRIVALDLGPRSERRLGRRVLLLIAVEDGPLRRRRMNDESVRVHDEANELNERRAHLGHPSLALSDHRGVRHILVILVILHFDVRLYVRQVVVLGKLEVGDGSAGDDRVHVLSLFRRSEATAKEMRDWSSATRHRKSKAEEQDRTYASDAKVFRTEIEKKTNQPGARIDRGSEVGTRTETKEGRRTVDLRSAGRARLDMLVSSVVVVALGRFADSKGKQLSMGNERNAMRELRGD
jgi:hypothetical protein